MQFVQTSSTFVLLQWINWVLLFRFAFLSWLAWWIILVGHGILHSESSGLSDYNMDTHFSVFSKKIINQKAH